MSDFRDRLDAHVNRWVNKSIASLGAYKVPDSSGLLKLDAMENPFVWPESMQQEWSELMHAQHVNRYPHPEAPAVKEKITQLYALPEGAEILLGNGSDELIQLIAMAVNGKGRKIMAPDPSFVMYEMVAKFVGMEFVGLPLTDDFELPLEATIRAIEVEDPAVIFLAQPNNPTGNLWGNEKLKRVLEVANGLVVIDEAYTAFTQADYLDWLEDYPNLLIMRTFSKVGLAGLRLGMLFGHQAWIEQINKLRLPYNINSLTQATAVFALDHFEVFENQTKELVRQRTKLAEELKTIEGLTVYPSEANFLLVKTPADKAASIHAALIEHGILVKKLDGGHTALKDCLRINISSSDDNRRLVDALRTICS
jgi:histidinol-phosphate aminotransferase